MTQTAPHRGNCARPLRASNLVLDLAVLAGVTRKFVKCPCCGRFVQVKRSQLTAHDAPDAGRCPNSRRALICDVPEDEWATAYDQAARHLERTRRPSRVHYKPSPATPTPVHRLRFA